MDHHLMVDIETMDTAETAVIMSIGAVVFDPTKPDVPDTVPRFDARISLKSNTDAGRTLSPDTVVWWLQQSKEAQAALFAPPISNLRATMTSFRMWIEGITPAITRVWAKDPDFDIVILKHAFRTVKERWPLPYWMARSVRTATEMAYPNGDEPTFVVGTAHNASDDALKQARLIHHCWRKTVMGLPA